MYRKRNNELDVVALYTGNYATRFYLRQICKLSGLPLKTVQTTLIKLEEGNILRSKVEGKNKYFSLNMDDIRTKSYLMQAEIHKTDIFLDKYPQFKTFMKSVSTNVPLIVFGSFARLKAGKDSDLDLLVISEKKQNLPSHLLAYNIHQVVLPEKTFIKALEKRETLIKEVEDNHVVLNDHSFYVNKMWDHYGK
jgi:predicted nucleotidyltransferase